MKKAILLASVFALVALAVPATASADQPSSPPGQGECQHGNSGKECRPDPQPTHGQECEAHGQQGGVNEDHCAGGEQPPVDPPVDPVDPVEPVDPPTDPGTPECGLSINQPTCVPPGIFPVEQKPMPVTSFPRPTPKPMPVTSFPKPKPTAPVKTAPVAPTQKSVPVKPGKSSGAKTPTATPEASATLPYTGLPLWAYALAGLGLIGGGMALLFRV